ncbi:MAG: heme-binding protein, partial [Anaerolineae bacterium]|nr:heme-binding protein [Anaerolineae bacterium]
MHQTYTLSHTDAMKIVTAIQSQLEQENKGAAIAVADEHGELMAFVRTDGCPLASIYIAMNKAFTASRERKESKAVGAASKEEGFP